MTNDEDELKRALRWPVDPPPEAMRDRWIANALLQPQLKPWPQAVLAEIERGLSDWRYGLAYKAAAMAACLVLGVGIGVHLSGDGNDPAGAAFTTEMGVDS